MLAFLKKGGWVIPFVYPFSFLFCCMYASTAVNSVPFMQGGVFIIECIPLIFSKVIAKFHFENKNLEYFLLCVCPPFCVSAAEQAESI